MHFFTTLALASVAIASPAAVSCIGNSKNAVLTISDFSVNGVATYSTPSHLASSKGTTSFALSVSPLKAPIPCSATSSQLYPTIFGGQTWYQCNGTNNLSASFKYNLASGTVNLKTQWTYSGSSWSATATGKTVAVGGCDVTTKKNKLWSLKNLGKYYQQISTSCQDKKTTIKPIKVSAVA